MGVTITSKNHSIDMGYGGFSNLRTKIAELTNEEIYQHYCELFQTGVLLGNTDFFKQYNAKTEIIDKKYEYKYNYILYFLYAPDCDATMPPDVCEKIWEVIKDYDDDILYGYTGRPDCAKFNDFKAIVKDCVDNQCDMVWY